MLIIPVLGMGNQGESLGIGWLNNQSVSSSFSGESPNVDLCSYMHVCTYAHDLADTCAHAQIHAENTRQGSVTPWHETVVLNISAYGSNYYLEVLQGWGCEAMWRMTWTGDQIFGFGPFSTEKIQDWAQILSSYIPFSTVGDRTCWSSEVGALGTL